MGGAAWVIQDESSMEEALAEAAALVRRSGLVIYPTETFYGLGAHPLSPEAIERIYRIKGREGSKALPSIAASVKDAKRATAHWPPAASRLAEAFWPGPLSLLLPATSELPPMLHAHTGKIAVRVSSHPVARRLAEAVGGLLISTSANRSGHPSCRDPRELDPDLLNRVDGFIDSGALPGGLPSTLVDLTTPVPRIVRSGCISWDQIREILALP